MADTLQREVTFYTPFKKYSGLIDIKSDGMRTLDLLNGSSIYWKDPTEKSFNDSLQMFNVTVELQGGKRLAGLSKLQLRLSEIIFFTDNLTITGDLSERMRAQTLSQKAQEKISSVRLFTKIRGSGFYTVMGSFYGLFKNKSQQRFFPLTDVKVREIIHIGGNWENREVLIENKFLGVSTESIESCVLGA